MISFNILILMWTPFQSTCLFVHRGNMGRRVITLWEKRHKLKRKSLDVVFIPRRKTVNSVKLAPKVKRARKKKVTKKVRYFCLHPHSVTLCLHPFVCRRHRTCLHPFLHSVTPRHSWTLTLSRKSMQLNWYLNQYLKLQNQLVLNTKEFQIFIQMPNVIA